MRQFVRLFDKSRGSLGLLVMLALLGAAAAALMNSEDFQRYVRMRWM